MIRRLSAPASVRVFACGATESGKTTLLRNLLIDRVRRALILDRTGEWSQSEAVVIGLPALRDELRRCIRARSWRIVASLDDDEAAELAGILVPPGNPLAGYCYAIGGMLLADDEIDQFAGQSAPAVVTGLWQRGRHAGLSIAAASQRPALVHRTVTAQSRWILICATHEPGDLAYLAKLLSADALVQLRELPPYHAIMWNSRDRGGWLLNPKHERIAPLGSASRQLAGKNK